MFAANNFAQFVIPSLVRMMDSGRKYLELDFGITHTFSYNYPTRREAMTAVIKHKLFWVAYQKLNVKGDPVNGIHQCLGIVVGFIHDCPDSNYLFSPKDTGVVLWHPQNVGMEQIGYISSVSRCVSYLIIGHKHIHIPTVATEQWPTMK